MRTTLDLPDDLHRLLTALASSNRTSLSQTAVALIRQGLQGPRPAVERDASGNARSAVTGLPLVPLSRVITSEDVRALDDEA